MPVIVAERVSLDGVRPIPGGKLPTESDQMKGVLPPEVLTVAAYDVPILPLGKLVVVIFTCA
jgi:hypothetical protein